MDALRDGAIREHKLPDEIKVMAADRIAEIHRSTADGPGCGVVPGAAVIGLKHVPIWLYHLAHPEAVVGTVDHMNTLQPVDP